MDIMRISTMMRKTNYNAEVGRLQEHRYWGRKGFSQRRQAENLFQVLAFHILKTFHGVVEVIGWLCISGACFRSLNT